MARKDVPTLRDEAAAAIERGRLGKAAEIYAELEALEPESAAWSKKLGETYRRGGSTAKAIAAFERAADKYASSGFMVQAIAVCKMVLQIDPENRASLDRLAALQPKKAAPPRSEPAIIVSKPPPAEIVAQMPPGSGLDALEIASVVPGSHKHLHDDGSESGIIIVPLDDDDLAVAPDPAAALRKTPLFAELDPLTLERLVPKLALLAYPANTTLFTEGQTGTSLCVISEGEVIVESGGTELARLGAGAFFGEISLVTDMPRSATVRTATEVELLGIDREVIREAAAERPEIIKVLMRFVRDRLVDRMTRTSEIFGMFGDADRGALASRFELVEVVPGSRMIEQGQRADGLYVVVAGRVEVLRDGHPLAMLRTGDVFGEMSLLSGDGATATVTAGTRVLALRLPARTFTEVIMTHPQVLAYLGELAAKRAPRTDFADHHIDII